MSRWASHARCSGAVMCGWLRALVSAVRPIVFDRLRAALGACVPPLARVHLCDVEVHVVPHALPQMPIA
eukprot:12826825-Alexandrium_andersonii.AAC.1